MKQHLLIALAAAALVAVGGCASSGPAVRSQAYASLRNARTFEYEFPTVWKGIEAAVRGIKVEERDPREVDSVGMRKLTRRTLETDWFYAQSRDKYQQYEANGSPRKIYLQTRIKYEIEARRSMGGTDVVVVTHEEVEKLKKDGTPDGYDKSDTPDPSRANEMLDKIGQSILSAGP